MNHLTQPNKDITIPLDFEASDGRKWTHYYNFQMEPVITSTGEKTWRSVQNEDDLLFERWCEKNQYKSRHISLFEAMEVFKDDLYNICINKIAANENKEKYKHILAEMQRAKNSEQLDVPRAKQYPIEQLVTEMGYYINRAGFMQSPFIDEKQRTPSCKIDRNKNFWWDFATAQGGDTIQFLILVGGMDFKDAVKKLT